MREENILDFIGIRTHDDLSKSSGVIIGVEKKGFAVHGFRILLDSGVIVIRGSEQLFVQKTKKKIKRLGVV